MLKRLLETARKSPLLKLLLFFHGTVVAALAAYYYAQAETALWHSLLYVPVFRDAGTGDWRYQLVARGPSLLLPWHLLPQHVFWLGLDILVFGSLAIWWACRITGDELRHRLAGREKEAADQLLEAAGERRAADRRMREAGEREQALKVRESRAAARESEAADRERQAQARVEGKDAEMGKMSVALTRLKGENKDLRAEVRRLRDGS